MRGAICEIVSELGGEGTWFATRKSRMRLGLSSCGQLYRLALLVFSIEDFNLEIWKTPFNSQMAFHAVAILQRLVPIVLRTRALHEDHFRPK